MAKFGSSEFEGDIDLDGNSMKNVSTLYANIVYPSRLTNGLIGYWPGIQGSGTTLYDKSGNGNDGTINGAVWTDTPNGKTLDFDGTDDYIEIPDDNSLDVSSVTDLLWVNIAGDTGERQYIVRKTDAHQIRISAGYDSFWIHIWTSDGAQSQAWATDVSQYEDEWHLLAYTYDQSVARIYWDGVEKASGGLTGGAITSSTNPVYIGRVGGSNTDNFNGKIDEVRIYDRDLSAQEITNIYEKTRGIYGV